jgi:succinate dehydrogenase flavoprotein subunit
MLSKKDEIIVVGGGASGIAAALSAIESGANVKLISLDEPRRSQTASIRTGINAALPVHSSHDSIEGHIENTYLSGASLAHRDAVVGLCESAPKIVGLLARMGVVFDRTREGRLDSKMSYGSNVPRCNFSGLSTGQSVLSALDGQLRRAVEGGHLTILSQREFISLIVDDEGQCRGVITSDAKNTKIEGMSADAVVMCSGGYEGLFSSNTGSLYSNGSAAIACFIQGATFANPEFSSIHPFTIGIGSKRIPITESVFHRDIDVWIMRGGKKHDLLSDELSDMKFASMDEIARRVWTAARDSGSESVHLDFTHMDCDVLEKCFPRLLDVCRIADIDPMEEPLRVEPAVYYSLGGLCVDADHATTIDGLFAAGSCASRYHGAGMLTGNEILSSVHGGLIAGRSVVRHASGKRSPSEAPASLMESAVRDEEDAIAEMLAREGGGSGSVHAMKRELGEILYSSASISKDDENLSEAFARIVEMQDRIKAIRPLDGAQWANDEISAIRNVQRELVLARLIVEASKNRCESRGAHYKAATPAVDDENWRVTTKATFGEDQPSFDYSEKIDDVVGE